MASLKIAREAGQHDPDNVDDAMGYLHMVPEVRQWMGRDKLLMAEPAGQYQIRPGSVLASELTGLSEGGPVVGREMDQMRGDFFSRQGIIRE